MARWSPNIISVDSTSGGGFEVKWEVDPFFSDSETPEKVLIDLNGARFKELDGEEDTVEVPGATVAALGVQVLVISVTFWWSGSPPDEKMSFVEVPLQIGGPVGGVNPAAKPIVTVLHVQPRTVNSASNIKISWRSNNYNDGNIFWGPKNAREAFRHSIRPVGTVYHGTFTTNQILTPATDYYFKVEVRNALNSPNWISTTVVARSAPDILSVRQFLITSGKPVTTGLATVVGPTKSIRKLLVE